MWETIANVIVGSIVTVGAVGFIVIVAGIVWLYWEQSQGRNPFQ